MQYVIIGTATEHKKSPGVSRAMENIALSGVFVYPHYMPVSTEKTRGYSWKSRTPKTSNQMTA